MKVSDMHRNPVKTKAENLYIAEAKYKLHLKGETSY